MGMGRRWGLFAGVVLASLTLAACSATNKQVRKTDPDAPYRIGREDVLDVSVWRDPELTRTVPVRPDGFISMPLIGEVKAAGKTPNELAAELRNALATVIQDPRVSIIVRDFNSSRVFVTGEVAHPGAYPLRGRVSVLQAITLAGGFSDFANKDGIIVMRNGPDGGQIPVRYSDIVDAEAGAENDVLLQPGDTVIVR